MAKNAAPAKLTGGAGFRFEDHVAARLLLDMLGATNSLGDSFGRIVQLDWQARDAGWHADDLAVRCNAGTIVREAGFSIKSDRQVTASGFPPHFVTALWEHWLGLSNARTLRRDQDVVVLVTGPLAAGVDTAWQKNLREALQTTPERMAARLAPPLGSGTRSQSSTGQRALFESLRCPADLPGSSAVDDAETVRALRHVRLLHFDFESPTSRDEGRAVGDAQRLLVSGEANEGRELWRRLIDFAAEQRTTGGATDLPKLLAVLRGCFPLIGHPDHRADWGRLQERSAAIMADVRDAIAGLGSLPRNLELEGVRSLIARSGCCLVTGQSGSGKSAIAKRYASQSVARVVWFNSNDFQLGNEAAFGSTLGLANHLPDVLLSSPVECLVVLDGLEHCGPDGLRVAGRLIRSVRSAPNGDHVRFLMTCQAEASGRVTRALQASGVRSEFLQTYQLDPPTLDQIRELLSPVPDLSWASFRPELRELLTNLKVLDLVVQAVHGSGTFDPTHATTLSSLIDHLWERWIEGDEGNVAASHILMQLGIGEAESLTAGIPRIDMGFAEQQALPALVRKALVRIRGERVMFTHDLLGDWARLRVCIGADPTTTSAARVRAASPRWHRAVRLYGRRLLEVDGITAWQEALRRADDGTDSGIVLQDVLLEGLILAGTARTLFDTAWPSLAADGGSLLRRLLDRFLIVATLPDPRLTEALGADAARFEHLHRIPLHTYWVPVLGALHAHREDVIRIAMGGTVRIAALWLRTMPIRLDDGLPFPWRRQAAEVALAAAREAQAMREEGDAPDEAIEQTAYEAALLGSADIPGEVGELCLELAQRRDLHPDVRVRGENAEARGAERLQRLREEEPERAAEMDRLCRPIFPIGDLRMPWPDGPTNRVADAFRNACLNTGAFISLCRSQPTIAREVLLAICIEEPQHDDPHECFAVSENWGIEYWREGHPPLYDRGPFLAFLRERPDEGLGFTLRLINFATHRNAEAEERQNTRFVQGGIHDDEIDDAIEIELDGSGRQWLGDPRVFRWYNDWPHETRIVSCCLMALEFWIYERIEQGLDVTPYLARLLAESESLAFAGLLVDVGKRHPQLLTGVLRPILGVWELYDLDLRTVMDRGSGSPGLIGWNAFQPSAAVARARDWYLMPHRKLLLRDLAQRFLLQSPEMREFFATVRANWSAQLQEGQPRSLRLLIDRLNPANYLTRRLDDGRVEMSFQWSEDVQQSLVAEQRVHEDATRRMLFPWQCRERLDQGSRMTVSELPGFWDELLRISESEQGSESDEPEIPVSRPIDAVCGGVAVLICLHPEYLAENPDREAWCRSVLERVTVNPPRVGGLESELALGNRHWDAFAAEAGVAMLAANANDGLARRLVARGAMAFRYATVELCFRRAFEARNRLGPDFLRLVHLLVDWAAVRALLYRCRALQLENGPYFERAGVLEDSYVGETMTAELPSLIEANLAVQVELASLLPPEHRVPTPGRRIRGGRHHNPGLDAGTLQAGLGWLDIRATTNADERRRLYAAIHDLLTMCLGSSTPANDPQDDKFEGRPGNFDRWILETVARTIRSLGHNDDSTTLWNPILDLPTHAHHWVEQFFWYWFPDGPLEAADRETFISCWIAMIRYALAHPGWEPARDRRHHVGDMVIELLGFYFRMEPTVGADVFLTLLGQYAEEFERAAVRWCVVPKVAYWFARFVIRPCATSQLLPLLVRLNEAIRTFDSDWRERGLENALVDFLRTCWEKRRAEVSSDETYRQPFLSILHVLTARGNHAAVAFNTRVIEMVGQQ